MRIRTLTLAGTMALALAALTSAQQSAPPAHPAEQGPRPKTQKESDALQKVQAATISNDPKAIIAAINDVLENFTDTEFKPMLLDMATQAAQQTGDLAETEVWGDRAVQANPTDLQARVLMADMIAANTHDTDFDKDQSIKKAGDYAGKVLELLPSATPASAAVNPSQWAQLKPRLIAEAHNALGQLAAIDKKYPDAIREMQAAIDADPSDPMPLARLTKIYSDTKQYDNAMTTADKVLAMKDCPTPDNSPCALAQVKTYVTSQKNFASKMKAASAPAKPAAPASAAPAPAAPPNK